MAMQGCAHFWIEESMGLTTSQFWNKNGSTEGRVWVALDGSSSSKTTHNTIKNLNNNQPCIGNMTELTAIAMPTLKGIKRHIKLILIAAVIIIKSSVYINI